jgi:hypothetical protein
MVEHEPPDRLAEPELLQRAVAVGGVTLDGVETAF